jgi:O-acetyl-ADP-ribose deacetylase (regulator of RNase III)
MLSIVQGNLLLAGTEAVVNTVNTVGVMGKGIALAFKESYPEIFQEYKAACKRGEVQIGRMFVTENRSLDGPRWVIHFPTKEHWRNPSQPEWIQAGLQDLRAVIDELGIRSIAVPPLGCGQGGLDWQEVRPMIEAALGDLNDVEVQVFEPTQTYYTPRKRSGSETLTPASALVAEAVRRYSVLGIECSLLEVQKLAYFIERCVTSLGLRDPLRMQFKADRYGPYSDRLRHLLNDLDGAWLTSEKRLADAGPLDRIYFRDERRTALAQYLASEPAAHYRPALARLSEIIDGFESPLGMELLATVDWLLAHERAEGTIEGLRKGLREWPAGNAAARRKEGLFDDRLLGLALNRLAA